MFIQNYIKNHYNALTVEGSGDVPVPGVKGKEQPLYAFFSFPKLTHYAKRSFFCSCTSRLQTVTI